MSEHEHPESLDDFLDDLPAAPSPEVAESADAPDDDRPGAASPDGLREIANRLFAESYRRSQPLQANLGVATWQLLGLNNMLHEAAMQFFRHAAVDPAALEKLYPHLEVILKVNRQVERFAQLQVRSSQAALPKPPNQDKDSDDLKAFYRSILNVSGGPAEANSDSIGKQDQAPASDQPKGTTVDGIP